jgi:K+-transporting ATPase KdpF subunit
MTPTNDYNSFLLTGVLAMDDLFSGLIVLGLLIYLTYALIYPEKF